MAHCIPDYVQTTVKKMLSCRDPESLGYHKYACPDHPDQFITVPHSCKSRFCSTCGKTLKTKKRNKWKHCSFIPFIMLHKRWRSLLIDTLKNSITKYLKNNPDCGQLTVFSNPSILHAFFAPLLSINWYVHDSKELEPQNFSLSYLARYSKRPPLAERRILYYGKIPNQDGIYVTFLYKESGKLPVHFTVPVEKFISLLIQHILPANFRQVRFYGALANRVKSQYQKLIGKALKKARQCVSFAKWRERQKLLTGQDPFICPICGKEKILVEIAYPSRKTGTLSLKSIPL